jgi:hypothetical protein
VDWWTVYGAGGGGRGRGGGIDQVITLKKSGEVVFVLVVEEGGVGETHVALDHKLGLVLTAEHALVEGLLRLEHVETDLLSCLAQL